MKKSKSRPNPEEFVQFWNFWKWQYLCRNGEYREAYNNYINVEIPEWIYREASDIFDHNFSESSIRLLLDAAEEEVPTPFEGLMSLFELGNLRPIQSEILDFGVRTEKWRNRRRKPFDVKFSCSPKDPNEDCDSEEILKNALNKTLKKDIKNLNLKAFEKDDVDTLDPPCCFSFFVDTRKPIDLVIAEIIYWYTVHSPEDGSEEIKSAHSKLVALYIDHLKYGFNRDADKERAVGLWLWDHKKKMEEKLGEKYPIAKATRDLYQRYNLEGKGTGYGSLTKNPDTTIRRLRRYYHAAHDSIKDHQILPIDPSK